LFVFALYILKPETGEKPIFDSDTVSGNSNVVQKRKPAIPGQATSKMPAAAATDDIIVIDSVETYERMSRYGKLSNCLRGTQIDGGLRVDGTGSLVTSGEIKSLFEYFLSAMHEEGKDTSIARIKEYIELTLPNPAREEALTILDDYLNYRNNVKRFNPRNLSESSKAEALMDLKAAIYEREMQRREFLSPEVVDAFFAEEEAFDSYNLSRMEIEYDQSLNDDQKLEMLSELNRQLPDIIRESRTYRTQEIVLKKKVEELKAQGEKEDEIYELRKKFYGEKAADRLAELDRERTAWQNRFDAYHMSKQIILNSSDLNDNEKDLQINRLKMESFSETELYKVDIFEKIRDEQ
jgi:lipase chaperone LimK